MYILYKWLDWHPKGNILLAGANDSTIWMWQGKLNTNYYYFFLKKSTLIN